MSLKKCLKCGHEKDASDFGKNKARADGLHYYCKACIKLKDAAYASRKKQRGKERAAKNAEFKPSASIQKYCNKCLTSKPQTDFYLGRRESDGLQAMCKLCCAESGKAQREANPEKERIRHAKYHAANKNRINLRCAEWQKNNRDKRRVTYRKFYVKHQARERQRKRKIYWRNPEKERKRSSLDRLNNIEARRKYDQKYSKENKAKVNALQAKRRFKKKNASVKWANKNKILAFYEEARRLTDETGIIHNVDHIVPLTSRIVCGLHCEFNLQVIEQIENIKKGNRGWPNMP